LRTDKNNNFKFTIKFLMTLDRSYIGYLGFLGIDLFKSVLMYSNGAICLIKLLFDLGLFTVQRCGSARHRRVRVRTDRLVGGATGPLGEALIR
jgi:hypothetical protein